MDKNIPSEKLLSHCIIACVGNEKDSEQVTDNTAQQPFFIGRKDILSILHQTKAAKYVLQFCIKAKYKAHS